jgi:hypothetical protein
LKWQSERVNILTVAFAVALTAFGCNPRPVPPETFAAESGPVPLATLESWADTMTGAEVFAATVNAVSNHPGRGEILATLARDMDRRIIEYLATQSRAAILGKLDSLKRGTHRHNYTRAQLEAALALKDARAKSPPPPRVVH